MPVVSTTLRRKMLSELLKGTSTFEEATGNNYNFGRVTVYAASNTDMSTVGTVLFWNATADQWQIAGNTSTIGTEAAVTLPGDPPLCIVVGPREGRGMAPETVVVGTGGTEVSVLFRGPATVVREGLEYAAQGILSAKQLEIETQLEKQGISVSSTATTVVPNFVA